MIGHHYLYLGLDLYPQMTTLADCSMNCQYILVQVAVHPAVLVSSYICVLEVSWGCIAITCNNSNQVTMSMLLFLVSTLNAGSSPLPTFDIGLLIYIK